MEWEDKFSAATLQAGKDLFEQGKVGNLKRTERGYEAMVGGEQFCQVKIGMTRGRVTSLYCDCPVSKTKAWCRHVAAVMFAFEEAEEQQIFSGTPDEATEEPYDYFQIDRLKNMPAFSPMELAAGQKLIDSGQITLRLVSTGYEEFDDKMTARAEADIKKGDLTFRTQLVFNAEKVLEKNCECPECVPKYFFTYGRVQKKCVHLAGLYLLLADYLKKNEVGDATDKTGSLLLARFQDQRAANQIFEREVRKNCLEIQPRLLWKDEKFFVDFRIGVRDGHVYVIKRLSEFSELVRQSKSARYGTSAVLNHDIRNFTQESQKYIAFIDEIVDGERDFARRQMKEGRAARQPDAQVGQQIELTGKRMDDFYDLVGASHLEYEERLNGSKTKKVLTCRMKNPQIVMQIDRIRGKTGVFQGIQATAAMPQVIHGLKYTYFIEEHELNRMDEEFARYIEPLLAQAKNGTVSFQIGRHQLQTFYYTVLPELRECLDVEIRDEAVIREHLLPEAKFVFYLDAEEQDVTCRAHAVYGEREVSLIDCETEGGSRKKGRESFRDSFRESEVLYVVRYYFSYTNTVRDEFSCGRDEEAIFRVLSDGVQELMKYGEVQSTDRFRRLNLSRRAKVTIGVSLHSGLLDLDIASDDISSEELLDVLASYRQKKRFHRLKNGDFLSLDTDMCAMLDEMMESLHLRPKEFVAGKMQIPAYRALYLDKMLEGHDSVYTQRDAQFKKLVRDFRAVQDADYKVPASLQKILRNYQKTGYRWLRTIQAGHFGGILADDMGLGKTLQVITVLLAQKEEGSSDTSLIICPASLVYNWGEEFARYAPSLSVCFVTGTQEERQKKIVTYQTWDVLITSYDLLKRDIDIYEDMVFGLEVLDEAQYIKNHTTAAAKAVKLIRAKTRFALTGTPIENRLSELWSIFDYLMPGFLYRYEDFKKEFETRIMKQEDEEAANRLRRLVSPFILRRLKQDVLKDLPDKIEEVRYAHFEEEQRKLYDAQVVHMRQTIAMQDPADFQKNRFEILKELTRLRQICCDPSLCFEAYDGGSAKLESVLELVESAAEGGHRILLFSQFTSMLARIRTEFDERGITYYEITGSTPKEKRLSLVKQFNKNEVQVFLISLKAGGTGLNLTGADVVIHYDPWWNVAVQNQATDRAHRIGQEKIVTVYKLIVKGTIEEKIQKLQENKQNLADQIISGQTDSLTGMTQEELLELLS